MPLSEHEQRILADIEARLRADDPKLARTVGTPSDTADGRRLLRLAALGFGLGFLLLFVGIIVHLAWGVAGFVLMLVSAVAAANTIKQLGAAGDGSTDVRNPLQRYLDLPRRRDAERDDR